MGKRDHGVALAPQQAAVEARAADALHAGAARAGHAEGRHVVAALYA